MSKDVSFKNHDRFIQLGIAISTLRRMRGMSQEQLAEMIDADRTTIGKLETAAVGASLDTVFSIARALNVAPIKLFDFRDEV